MTMKNINRIFLLLLLSFTVSFLSFISSISAQTSYSAVVASSDGYDVNITLTPISIAAPSSCEWGYNFNVDIDFEITFKGKNIPASLYTLQGNMGCGSFAHNFFDLPNSGGVGTTTTVGNPWNSDSDCTTATIESLFCNDIDLVIQGSGIPYQTINLSPLLPVELYSYEVKLNDNKVGINWTTASEVDNDYFIVERSDDAYHFEEVGREEGKGFSESFQYYSMTDYFPYKGISYYRLKQVDFDGTTTNFDIKTVDNKNEYSDKHSLSVFPNPIMGQSRFNIDLEGFGGNTVQVKIQNMSGVLIYSSEVEIFQEKELIELETNIIQDSGMYVVSVFSGNNWYSHKFMFVK